MLKPTRSVGSLRTESLASSRDSSPKGSPVAGTSRSRGSHRRGAAQSHASPHGGTSRRPAYGTSAGYGSGAGGGAGGGGARPGHKGVSAWATQTHVEAAVRGSAESRARMGVGTGYQDWYTHTPEMDVQREDIIREREESPFVRVRDDIPLPSYQPVDGWPRSGYVAPPEWDRSDPRWYSHLRAKRVHHAKRKNITNPVLLTEYPAEHTSDSSYGALNKEFDRFLPPREEPPELPPARSPQKGAPIYRSYLRPAEDRFANLQPEVLQDRDLRATDQAFRSLPKPPPTFKSMKDLRAQETQAVLSPLPSGTMGDLVQFDAPSLIAPVVPDGPPIDRRPPSWHGHGHGGYDQAVHRPIRGTSPRSMPGSPLAAGLETLRLDEDQPAGGLPAGSRRRGFAESNGSLHVDTAGLQSGLKHSAQWHTPVRGGPHAVGHPAGSPSVRPETSSSIDLGTLTGGGGGGAGTPGGSVKKADGSVRWEPSHEMVFEADGEIAPHASFLFDEASPYKVDPEILKDRPRRKPKRRGQESEELPPASPLPQPKSAAGSVTGTPTSKASRNAGRSRPSGRAESSLPSTPVASSPASVRSKAGGTSRNPRAEGHSQVAREPRSKARGGSSRLAQEEKDLPPSESKHPDLGEYFGDSDEEYGPLLQEYVDDVKPVWLPEYSFVKVVKTARARMIQDWYRYTMECWKDKEAVRNEAERQAELLKYRSAKRIARAWLHYMHRKASKLVQFSEVPPKRKNEFGASSRPRFRPSRKAMSLYYPPDSTYKKHSRQKFAQTRMWLRAVTRAWRAQAAAQIHWRHVADKREILNRAFIRYTVTRRIMRKRLEYNAASMIQETWRSFSWARQVKAGTFIIPVLKRHLWYLRRQRLRSLRHESARALQRFAHKIIARLKERMGAEVMVKRAVRAWYARNRAREGREREWFRLKLAVKRIERAWFRERAFRQRILNRVTKQLAKQLVRARKRLEERRERIGPVHWELLNQEFIRQTKAAIKFQKVWRGHCGRYRAHIARMQLQLVQIPKDFAARKIQSGWKYFRTRRKLRIRRKKIAGFKNLKTRQLRERARDKKLGALSVKRFRRVRKHAHLRYKMIWAAKIIQKFYRRTRVRRLAISEANRIFKMKHAILLLESCAVRLQKRWLKHRYPFGLPKYRRHRDEAAEMFQKVWRGYIGRKKFKEELREAQREEAERLRQEKADTVARYRFRQGIIRKWIYPFIAARLAIIAWRAQWSLVYKTAAAKQLGERQFHLAMKIQRKWRQRIAHRKGVINNREALHKMYGKMWKKARMLKPPKSKLQQLLGNNDLRIGDRVLARWCGGVKEFPAIIVNVHYQEEKEKVAKDGTVETVETLPYEAPTFDLKYADGAIEHQAKRDWLTFDMRPYLAPQEGLYDEDFLNAEKEPLGLQTIKDFVKKIQDRHYEIGAAQSASIITPDVPGKKPGDRIGITGVAIIVGEKENKRFQQQQTQRRMLFQPYYAKLYPDLRGSARTGREREDRDSVHVWIMRDKTGPFVTDVRIVFKQYMKPDTPFWNAIRDAGFNKLIRPNLLEADTYPLPTEEIDFEFPFFMVLKVNSTENPLLDLRVSSLLAGEGSPYSGATETDLFQEGYTPLPEDLVLVKMDAKTRVWLKWRPRDTEQPLVGVGRRESFDDTRQSDDEDGETKQKERPGSSKSKSKGKGKGKGKPSKNQYIQHPTRRHLEIEEVDESAPSMTTAHRDAQLAGAVSPPKGAKKEKPKPKPRKFGKPATPIRVPGAREVEKPTTPATPATPATRAVGATPSQRPVTSTHASMGKSLSTLPRSSPLRRTPAAGAGGSAEEPGPETEGEGEGEGEIDLLRDGAFPRRAMHSEITIKGIQEGRKNVQEAVGASSPIAGPFSRTQSFLKYGGNDLIEEAMRLRNQKFEEEEAGALREGSETASMSGYSVATPGTAGLMLPPVSPHSSAMSPAARSRGMSRRGSPLRRAHNVASASAAFSAAGRSAAGRSGQLAPIGSPLAGAGSLPGTGMPPSTAGQTMQSESEEEPSSEDESDGHTDASSEVSIPEQGEFDDGTEWGKYTTVYDEAVEEYDVLDLDGPQTDVVMSCRFSDAQLREVTEFFRALKPRVGMRGVGIRQIMDMIGWRAPLGPLLRELYHLVRVPETSLFKFKMFLEWLARFCLLPKPDLIRICFRAFDNSKRGDMSRGDVVFMTEILHHELSAPKRTHMVRVAGKLLALKTDSLGETFKYKDFIIMHQKFSSMLAPWFQIQTSLQQAVLGEDFWKRARERIQRMPQKPGGIEIPVVYEKYSGK